MNVSSLLGMSRTILLTPWNFPAGFTSSNDTTNCILALSPSSISVITQDDSPLRRTIASVTVSPPEWNTIG